jgi:hypothetical protein
MARRRGGTGPLLLAALVVLVAAMLLGRAAARDAFEQWASEHGKTYKSEAEGTAGAPCLTRIVASWTQSTARGSPGGQG